MRHVVFALAVLALLGVGIALLSSRNVGQDGSGTVERDEEQTDAESARTEPSLAGRESAQTPALHVRLNFEPGMESSVHRVFLQGVLDGEAFNVILAPWRGRDLIHSVASSWDPRIDVEHADEWSVDLRITGLPAGTFTVHAKGLRGGANAYVSRPHLVEVGEARAEVVLSLTRLQPTAWITAELSSDGERIGGAEFRVKVGDLTWGSDLVGPLVHRDVQSVPAEVPLTICVQDYDGRSIHGPIPPQQITLREGETRHLAFEAPKATEVSIRALSPGRKPVAFGLSLWREDANRRLVAINVTDVFNIDFVRFDNLAWKGRLPTGRYRVSASPNADLSRGWAAFEVESGDDERIVDVPVGDDRSAVSVRIRLVQADGTTPVASRRLNLNRVSEQLEDLDVQGAKTDEAGWLRTRPLMPGTYALILWSPTPYDGVPRHLARLVDIVRHDDVIELALPEPDPCGPGHLRGLVRDPRGGGASQVPVYVQRKGDPWFFVTRTSHSGTFDLTSLQGGTWVVSVPTYWMRNPTWGETSTSVVITQQRHNVECTLQVPRR